MALAVGWQASLFALLPSPFSICERSIRLCVRLNFAADIPAAYAELHVCVALG